MTQTRTFVIADGGVTSALACVTAVEAALSRAGAASATTELASNSTRLRHAAPAVSDHADDGLPVVWTPAFQGPTGAARLAAVERMCGLLGLPLVRGTTELDGSPENTTGDGAQDLAMGEDTTRALLAAGFEAARLACGTVLWPIQFSLGAELSMDLASRAIDRALLVSRLVSIDVAAGGGSAVAIEPPYADFSDAQIADLVIDLDAPFELCWWWHAEMSGGRPEHTALFRAERQRWLKVLEPVGWTRAAR